MTDDAEFLQNAKEIVDNFQRSIGCDPDENKCEEFVQCPVDDCHRLPLDSLQNHSQSCKWRSYGYSKEEVKEILESESQPKISSCIDLDKIISEIHPGLPPIRSHERYVIELSREERLRVYDVMMESVQSHKREIDPKLLVDFNDKIKGGSSQKAIDELELLKMQRDHKRRRQTYRAKNVHITKRSQTEIIREVLRIHMDEYRQSLIGDHEDHDSNTKSGEREVTQSSNITKSHGGSRNDWTSTSRHDSRENYDVTSSEVKSHERRRERDRDVSYERRDDRRGRSYREEQHRDVKESRYDHYHSREKRRDRDDARTSRDKRDSNLNENDRLFRDEKRSREVDTTSQREKSDRDKDDRFSFRDKRSHDDHEPFEYDESSSRKKKSRRREHSYERNDHDRDRSHDEDREIKRKSKKEKKKHSKKKKDSKKD